MITFDISRLFPRFLLNDREGYAMCRALEAGLNEFLSVCQDALNTWQDPDTMPEWRLDELAWEYNCPYDYYASIENKRKWIANAYSLARIQGTPAAIKKYLEGYFDNVDVQEAGDYATDPYHFRVIVDGMQTEESSSWAQKAIAKVKNVRSVLDSVTYNGGQSETEEYFFSGVSGIEILIQSRTV